MDKRRSMSRVVSHGSRPTGAAATSICPSSPSSGGESPTNTTSTLHSRSPRRRKHFPETPQKVLRKQRSAEDLQLRGGLWPSAKNHPGAPNTNVSAATLQDHLINDRKNEEEEEEEELLIVGFETHAASTFSSRQRARSNSSAFEINISNGRGRRYRPSLSPSASKKKQQPGTPPSPSSSSSSSFSGPNIPSAARLPFSDENALAGRRSEFGLDFPSNESGRRDAGTNSRSRAPIKIASKVVRRSGSPVRRSKSPVLRNSRSPPVPRNSRSPPVLRQPTSPAAKEMISGGMGKIISMGLGGLFRRKSFSGSGVTVASTTTTTVKSSILVAKEMAINEFSGRRGMAEGVGSPARGAKAAVELQHELRMAHNHLMQWRFVNGRTVALNLNKWAMAQKALVSAWLGLMELRVTVTQEQLRLANHKLSIRLNTIISPQVKAMERWGNYMEKHHMAAISSTKNCLHAVVCRLPLTDRAKADPQILSILFRKATNLMAAINDNIAACDSMTQRTVPLVAELAQIVSKEKPLIEECFELLEIFSKLQFREESLRCHLIQLKT